MLPLQTFLENSAPIEQVIAEHALQHFFLIQSNYKRWSPGHHKTKILSCIGFQAVISQILGVDSDGNEKDVYK
ncbi:hypothetical protein NQ318_000395 [Aromia moschata]|uniref:Uncharacterized protein n=1 Tax=Aromia moschata TaxID=1265417 RepID=A0AAV8YVF9_9CUCU|nr:hypothetical protein NQ318_000395 [Aromia moschata]